MSRLETKAINRGSERKSATSALFSDEVPKTTESIPQRKFRFRTKKKEANKEDDIMNDLRKVGAGKPVGYLPISTVTNICHEDPEQIISDAREKGLFAKKVEKSSNEACIYIADPTALRQTLENYSGIFGGNDKIPSTEEYIDLIATSTILDKTKIFDMVADTFGDFGNPGRTDVTSKKRKKK